MNTQNIANAIETSPVRLTSDETRMLLRAAQTTSPISGGYGSVATSLIELGLFEKVPMETLTARAGRLALAWKNLRFSCVGKDLGLAEKAVGDIRKNSSEDPPPTGYVLTEIGRQVARGISVKVGKR